MKRLLAAFTVAALVGTAVAQDNNDDTLLKVDVNLVNLLFSVRDKKGALVPGLTKENFTVFEDGKQQTIRSFVRESNLPLTIGLLIDVSKSQENLIEVEKHAASQFFTQVLRPKDMAFLISFGTDAELLQDSTNSARLLRDGMNGLKVSVNLSGYGMGGGPVPTASKPKGTVLFDAVYLAAYEKLKSEVGRKAIVIISDGVDQGSRYDVHQAIEAAHKSDTIIYSIQYADPMYQSYFGGGGGDLKRMSEETGGRLFKVDRKHTLEEIFNDIQSEMRSQYSLSYTPTNSTRDGSFRKLEIRTTDKDQKVQARKGYYSTPQ